MRSGARFRVLRAGRRWGKTQLAAHETIMAALAEPDQMVWWVSNSDKNVRRAYRAILKQLPRALLAKDPPSEGANDRILHFTNGSQIELYTAGTPGSLAGEGVDFLVVDEAALIPEHVWYQLLRPTLSDTQGRALLISTPRGRNWFWKLWMRGTRGGEYDSFHYRSVDSPYVLDEEVEDAEDTLPRLIFLQEYQAEFVANAASMFDLTATEKAPRPVVEALGYPYGQIVLGCDLAKREDFTVVSGCRAGDRVPVVHERWNEVSWPVQYDLICGVVEDLEATPGVEGVQLLVDSTGLGDVVYDELDDRGLDVIPINFSGGQKERMVRLLAADLEHGRAQILEEQRTEFESYEYRITDAGRYKFEAAGGHDDEVSAKLLENWGVVHEAPPDVKIAEADEPTEAQVEEEIVADSTADIMGRAEAWSSSSA